MIARADALSAKDEYARGISLYKAGNYVDAAQAFISAYKLKPKPLILFNIGQAYRKMGALDGAVAYYQRFLKEAPPADRAPLEADTHKYIAELEAEIDAKRREEAARAEFERAARERRARETAEALAADRARLEREQRERAEQERIERHNAETQRALEIERADKARTDAIVKQAEPEKPKKPIYKSAALWAPIGVIVVVGVSLGVGLGVGLQPSLGTHSLTFP